MPYVKEIHLLPIEVLVEMTKQNIRLCFQIHVLKCTDE